MITPYICVADTRAALEWYVRALGAEVTVEPMVFDGKVGHAEVEVAGSRVMASDPHPELQVIPPSTQGAAVSLALPVDDVDALAASAAAAGATIDRGPEDNPPIGRICVLRDPFGHRWFLIQKTDPE